MITQPASSPKNQTFSIMLTGTDPNRHPELQVQFEKMGWTQDGYTRLIEEANAFMVMDEIGFIIRTSMTKHAAAALAYKLACAGASVEVTDEDANPIQHDVPTAGWLLVFRDRNIQPFDL